MLSLFLKKHIQNKILCAQFIIIDLNFLLKHIYSSSELSNYIFYMFRVSDVSYIIREVLLMELEEWIKIKPIYFIARYWENIYFTVADKSVCVQKISLQVI